MVDDILRVLSSAALILTIIGLLIRDAIVPRRGRD